MIKFFIFSKILFNFYTKIEIRIKTQKADNVIENLNRYQKKKG